jgi:hypothetical protein
VLLLSSCSHRSHRNHRPVSCIRVALSILYFQREKEKEGKRRQG